MKKISNYIFHIYNNKYFQLALMFGLFWLLIVKLELNRNLNEDLRGPHFWRQSDGWAQIMNYVNNGLNFFDFSVYYNQFNGSPKAVGEFPIFYYWIAVQKTLFGGNILFLVRINTLIFTFFGLFAFTKTLQHYIKHFLLSCVLVLGLFLSPVFAFYSFNLFPDPIAFSLMSVGFYFYLKFFKENNKKHLILSVICLSLSGMIKVYFLIPLIALILTITIHDFIKTKKVCIKKIFLLSIPIITTLSWIIFVRFYNDLYNCNCFLTTTLPYWELNLEQVNFVKKKISENYFSYGHFNYLNIFYIVTAINLIMWTKKSIFKTLFLLISLIGCASFFILFFKMYQEHDYYIFPFLFLIPLSLALFYYKLMPFFNEKKYAAFIIGSIAVLLYISVYSQVSHSFGILRMYKNTTWINGTFNHKEFHQLEHFLNKNEVSIDKKIISFSDKTPNYSLIYMNRKGWSGYQTQSLNWEIDQMIDMGAEFLIINNNIELKNDSLKTLGFTDHYIDDTLNVYLYDLRPYK